MAGTRRPLSPCDATLSTSSGVTGYFSAPRGRKAIKCANPPCESRHVGLTPTVHDFSDKYTTVVVQEANSAVLGFYLVKLFCVPSPLAPGNNCPHLSPPLIYVIVDELW